MWIFDGQNRPYPSAGREAPVLVSALREGRGHLRGEPQTRSRSRHSIRILGLLPALQKTHLITRWFIHLPLPRKNQARLGRRTQQKWRLLRPALRKVKMQQTVGGHFTGLRLSNKRDLRTGERYSPEGEKGLHWNWLLGAGFAGRKGTWEMQKMDCWCYHFGKRYSPWTHPLQSRRMIPLRTVHWHILSSYHNLPYHLDIRIYGIHFLV